MPEFAEAEVEEILFNRVLGPYGDIGVITLNRPKALNALTQTMCIAIHEALNDWQKDDAIKAVIVKGEGEKAFCAGGDIRQIYDSGAEKVEQSSTFFWHEYRMNAAIHHFTKPYIAFMDGITMGGGCGISMHGQFRVATERLMLAMPETGIGFFPDVGGGHFLSRCPDYTGYYMGLTGNRIDAADALYTGFATHVIDSGNMEQVIYELTHFEWGQNYAASVEYILSNNAVKTEESTLHKNAEMIKQQFNQSSVADICQALESCEKESCKEWCAKTLKTIRSKSPTSVLVTFEQLKRAADMSFDDALKMEFAMTWHFMLGHDFYEGVRAALVDKDRNPQWQPAQLTDVSADDVAQYFSDVPVALEL
ncbi:MAG: enoyl-CoA hydratase/isomerase family protein [Coxiellaceae bacterium]|nr:enoyl-CoA hydratase/isomerase family protein [Coxiellaceae bacterium]